MKICAGLTAFAWLAVSVVAQAQEHGMLPPPRVLLPETGVTLRMRDFGGRPVIDLMIAGRGPYAAVVDTGASGSVIDSGLSAQLKLPKAGGLEAAPEADGHAPELVTIAELGIGAAKCKGLTLAALPLSRMMPDAQAPKIVLSAEAFPGYLLTLDFPSHTVRLRKGALPPADGHGIFNYTPEEHIPMVPVKVGGVERRVHLDTGSPKGLTLPTEFMQKVALASTPQEAGKARTHGGEFKVYKAALSEPVSVGDFKIALPEILFSDVRPGGGPPAPPAGNIGSQALQDLVVTIDAANRTVQLAKR